MRLDGIIDDAAGHLLRPLLRRLLTLVGFAVLTAAALYHFTVAGGVTLAGRYGEVGAHLIIGAIYGALSAIALAAAWARRARTTQTAAMPALNDPRAMELLMLAEAIMLGYALARKSQRTR